MPRAPPEQPPIFVSTYLISEFAVFEKPELVLPVQIVSINVVKIHLEQKKRKRSVIINVCIFK